MRSTARSYRDIATSALDQLFICKDALFQIEALFLAMKNESLSRDTLGELVKLGLLVSGDIANLEEGALEKLQADFDAANSAPQNGNCENVARDREVQP